MPATQYGFSLGEALRDSEAIKTSRQRREINRLNMAATKEDRELAAAGREAGKNRNMAISKAKRNVIDNGDERAWMELSAIDPEGAASMRKLWGGMDDRQKEEFKALNESTANKLVTVVNASPEKQAALYRYVYSALPGDMQKELGETYNQDKIKVAIGGLAAVDKAIGPPTTQQQGGSDVTYTPTGVRESSVKTAVKPSAGKAGSNAAERNSLLKEENQMRSHVASLFGGSVSRDPMTGEMTFVEMNPDIAPKVQAIYAEALRMWRNNEVIDRGEAISKAAAKLGLDVPRTPESISNAPAPGTQGAGGADPMSLGSYSQPQR